jgi:methanogenic corrinoid protein MtbC1
MPERELMLRQLIEREMIPRLMLAYRGQAATRAVRTGRGATIASEHVRALAQALLEDDKVGVMALIDDLRTRGASEARLLLDLFAPAARFLGELWESDARTFTEVTIAIGALQQAVRDVEARVADARIGSPSPRGSILLLPTTNEQHTFPLTILDVFFRRAGWTVDADFDHNVSSLRARLKGSRFDVVALTVSRDCLLPGLASVIEQIRRACAHHRVRVLVGGRAISARPQIATDAGADAWAADARAAVTVAGRAMRDACLS